MKKFRLLASVFFVFTFLFAGILFAQNGSPAELPNLLLAVVGGIAPLVIMYINKIVPAGWRWVIAYVLSALTGVIALVMKGIPLTTANLFLWVSLGFTYSQLAYRLIWHKLCTKVTG